MLQLSDVHSFYGESHILNGITLKVKQGSVVGLFGRNGMGKTTTIRSIIGFTPPRKGKIFFKGEDITGKWPHKIARTGIGLVPQGRRIFSSLSVRENLLIAARERKEAINWNLEKIYSLFPVLETRASAYGNHLSGGEQQMLAIGRALMTNPELLLMDEPFEGLAPKIIKEIAKVIKQLKEDGYSILLVEPNFSMALELVDYLYVINKGQIVYELFPDELLNNKKVINLLLGL